MINVQEVKQKILKFLNEKGPSLPIHIAKSIELSTVFSSAILSELLNEKRIKTSSMRIGSSPLYMIPGQEQLIEKYAEENLTGTEKEAYLKLKQKKILDDLKQEPAIRVALRGIRDFASPIKYQERLYYKYAFTPTEEIQNMLSPDNSPNEKPARQEIESREIKHEKTNQKQIKEIRKHEERQLKSKSKKTNQKPDKFLTEIQEFLNSKNLQLISIESFDKKEVAIRVKNSEEFLLYAFDKKRINEKDILKASKKASELKLPYSLLSKSETPKKLSDTIEAFKKLTEVYKI